MFALLFAIVLIGVVWSILMYFAELGSEEGKREFKGMTINWITTLIGLMVLYALVNWLRGYFGI